MQLGPESWPALSTCSREEKKRKTRKQSRASLVSQWLRFHQPKQETRVQFLVQEDLPSEQLSAWATVPELAPDC